MKALRIKEGRRGDTRGESRGGRTPKKEKKRFKIEPTTREENWKRPKILKRVYNSRVTRRSEGKSKEITKQREKP